MSFLPYRLLRMAATTTALALLLLIGSLSANAQNSTGPLSKKDIIDLLDHGVTSQRIAALAHESKISFQMDPDTEAELFRAGATPELVEDLRSLAPVPLTVLVLHSHPG